MIVEILNEDGSMARRPDLEAFAEKHGLKIGTIEDLIRYRIENETTLERIVETHFPTDFGDFTLIAYEDAIDQELHLALVKGEVDPEQPVAVRVHVQNTLHDALYGTIGRGWPLNDVMQKVNDMGQGVIVFLRQSESPRQMVQNIEALIREEWHLGYYGPPYGHYSPLIVRTDDTVAGWSATAEDMSYVPKVHGQRLEARRGEQLIWAQQLGGRPAGATVLAGGNVIQACRDGYVYGFDAATGEPHWRFLAARADLRLVNSGQIESVWPLPGSVLIENGRLYCVAGRSMFLDGGLRFLRLDLATGKKLSENVLTETDPLTGKDLHKKVFLVTMPQALPTILVDGGLVDDPLMVSAIRERVDAVTRLTSPDDNLEAVFHYLVK